MPQGSVQDDYGALSPGYGPDTLTFETWCGEIRRYEASRCAKKNASDLAAYKVSLDRMRGFENKQQKKIRQDQEFRKQFDSHGDVAPTPQVPD